MWVMHERCCVLCLCLGYFKLLLKCYHVNVFPCLILSSVATRALASEEGVILK